MVETEAPAARRKPPETATPSTYSHRARRRLYPQAAGWSDEGLEIEVIVALFAVGAWVV